MKLINPRIIYVVFIKRYKMPRLYIEPSKSKHYKYTALFVRNDGSMKSVGFGHKSYYDYTQHGDKERRKNYIARHEPREDFNDPETAGALSRWILWGDSKKLEDNVKAFKVRFGYS
jgi:hypothetical protein